MDWRNLYFSTRGRIDRERYWLASVPLVGVQLAAGMLIGSKAEPALLVLGAVLYLAVTIPTFIITTKRLHDRGRSGWFMSIAAIPLLGALWLLIEAGLLPGTRGANRYGPDPLTGTGARSEASLTAPV